MSLARKCDACGKDLDVKAVYVQVALELRRGVSEDADPLDSVYADSHPGCAFDGTALMSVFRELQSGTAQASERASKAVQELNAQLNELYQAGRLRPRLIATEVFENAITTLHNAARQDGLSRENCEAMASAFVKALGAISLSFEGEEA